MANYLASNVIDSFQRTNPQVNDTDGLALYKEVLMEVVALLQIEGGSESKNLTDGTREYELTYDPVILNVSEVYYVSAAATATKLKRVSVDWMDANYEDWRVTTTTGTPRQYYIDAPTSASLTTQGKIVIGLDPIPDTTTSAGYPIVTIYGSEYEEPSATSDVPQIISDVRVLVEGMKRNYASDRGTTEEYLRFKSAFEERLAGLQGQIRQLTEPEGSLKVTPVWMRSQTVY